MFSTLYLSISLTRVAELPKYFRKKTYDDARMPMSSTKCMLQAKCKALASSQACHHLLNKVSYPIKKEIFFLYLHINFHQNNCWYLSPPFLKDCGKI